RPRGARARARGVRAGRRGERLVRHQRRPSRPPAGRHSRRADRRAALPLRRGVRPRRARAAVARARGGGRGAGGGFGGRASTLAAMMLDQKGAWDALVERHAPPEARDRILTNHFYQHLSQSFAGSYEYMAIEQLCALAESGRYDLIVVDTPPTRHALDFLEAPRRIAD